MTKLTPGFKRENTNRKYHYGLIKTGHCRGTEVDCGTGHHLVQSAQVASDVAPLQNHPSLCTPLHLLSQHYLSGLDSGGGSGSESKVENTVILFERLIREMNLDGESRTCCVLLNHTRTSHITA